MAKAADRIVNVLEQVEKIPWYWVGLFTSSGIADCIDFGEKNRFEQLYLFLWWGIWGGRGGTGPGTRVQRSVFNGHRGDGMGLTASAGHHGRRFFYYGPQNKGNLLDFAF